MKGSISKALAGAAILLMFPVASFGQILFSDSFDASPDWKSAETYSPTSNASWPATWADNPNGATQPPPSGWTSYRAAIPRRGGHDKTFVLNSEGAKNAGGKGMTYNIESSDYGSWTGGGLDVYLGETGHQELFLRMYLKYDPNTFHWGSVVPNFGLQKLGRISRYKKVPSLTNSPQMFLSGASDQTPTFYPDILNNPAYNTPPAVNAIHFVGQHVVDPGAGEAIPTDVWDLPSPSDGNWHCYEFRVKMNSAPGVADGEWEIWIDGSSAPSHHYIKRGLKWVDNPSSIYPGWNWVNILDNNTVQPDIAYANTILKIFMDDVMVSTNYSGPPPAPASVTAQAASANSARVSWTAGTSTAAYQLDGYRVYYGLDPANLTYYVSAGSATQVEIPGLQSGQTYYFAVTGYNKPAADMGENESLKSSKVSLVISASTQTPDSISPTASIASPANGSTVSGTTTVNVTATDNVGISKVELYINGAIYGVDGASPYSISWDTKGYANGSYQLVAKSYDVAGNIGQSSAVTITVSNTVAVADATAPSVTAFAMPATATALKVPVSSFSATDNVAVSGYLVTESTIAPAASAAGWTAAAPTSFTFASSGTRTAYAWVKDAAGNVSASRSASVTITLPAGPVIKVISPAENAAVPSTVTISTSATSNLGILQLRIYVDNVLKSYVDNASSLSWNWDTTTATKGAHTVTIYAFDKSSNLSTAKVSVTTGAADTTAPAVTAFTMPATATAFSVPVSTLTATDNVAVTGYLISESSTAPAASAAGWATTAPVSFTFAGTGARSAYAWAKDAAGNVSLAARANVTVTLPDLTAPVAALSAPAAGSTLSGTVNVSANASDNVGVTKVEFFVNGTLQATATAVPYAFSWNTTAVADGSYTVSAKAYDAAGNVGQSASVAVAVINDKTAPVVNSFTMPTTATTLTVPVSLFTATDNTRVAGYLITESATAPAAGSASWSATAPSSFLFAGAGARTAYAWAKDAAGNVSLARSATVMITLPDTTPPAITIISPAAGLKVPTKVTISASAADQGGIIQMRVYVDKVLMAVSSTSSISYAWDTTKTVKGKHSIEIWAFDAERNYGIAKVSVVK